MTGAAWDAIVLDAADHVATALRPLAKGETARVKTATGTVEIAVGEDIPLCHKIAVAAIASGGEVRKYGEVIGAAASEIAAGAHVHVHNLKSLRARAG